MISAPTRGEWISRCGLFIVEPISARHPLCSRHPDRRTRFLRARRARILCWFFCLQVIPLPAAADYLAQLIDQARKDRLSEQREWRVLLHYEASLIPGRIKSLVDSPDFFLAANGKRNAQSELNATLRGFFDRNSVDDESTRCRFPARFAWLRNRLRIDDQRLPSNRCKTLGIWLDNLSVSGITLIFPVAFLNNPASMFGHTLLRLDSRRASNNTELLAWTVNFAAKTEEQRGFSYAIKGLFGGYRGTYSVQKYFFRVKEYADLESRDIWEYRLDFSNAEIHRLLLHLWELLPVYFDYYFIDENCSYQLLSLLEAARPALHLGELFNLATIPTDTVRAVTAIPGMLLDARYRPSSGTVITARARRLDAGQRDLAEALALGRLSTARAAIEDRDPIQSARILELASDYAEYLNQVNSRHVPEAPAVVDPGVIHRLLSLRSKIPIPSQKPRVAAPAVRPDQGHASSRVRLSYGIEDPLHFLEMEYRWAYHDIFDPQGGYVDGAQIELFKPRLRYYPEIADFQLESLGLVNVLSLSPRNDFIRPISWKASGEIRRKRYSATERPLVAALNTGAGLTYSLPGNSLVSGFATASFEFSDHFSQFTAIAAGAEMRLLSDFTSRWRIGLSGELSQYFQGITQTAYRVAIKQRYALNRNHALLLDLGRSREFGDAFYFGQLSWQSYF